MSATVLPPPNGILYVQFLGTNTVGGGIGTNGAGGYLNCMQITQGPSTNATPPATPLNQTTLIQFGNNTLTNCTVGFSGKNVIYGNCPQTPNPDILGHYWNSVSSANFFPMTNALGQVISCVFCQRRRAPVVIPRVAMTLTTGRIHQRRHGLRRTTSPTLRPTRSAIWASRQPCPPTSETGKSF